MSVTAVTLPTIDGKRDSTPDFLNLYDGYDPMERYTRYQKDVTTAVVGIIFDKSIVGLNGPISPSDLAKVLKYRNKGYAAWGLATEEMVQTAFFKLSIDDGRWHDTFMHWQNLYDRDCTGNSSVEFKQVKAKLLTDLESAEEQSHYVTVDEAEILMDIVEDEEYLGGEDFEMIEAGQEGEDTDWMEAAP